MSHHPLRPARLAIFTICSNNYMGFAKAFLKTAKQHHPEADLFVCLADQPIEWPGLYDGNYEVVPCDLIGVSNFRNFVFQYTVIELNTALKPFFFNYLMEQRGYGIVLYFDPDIALFSRLNGVLDRLTQGASLVLTPHLCRPAEDETYPDDVSVMRSGVFNLGFLGAAAGPETSAIMHWWARRLRFQCIDAQSEGIFVDQKFMDLVPGFADRACIYRDTSLNVAYWNLSQRTLDTDTPGWTVDGTPLAFFHFSGFDPQDNTRLSKFTQHYRDDASPPLRRLMEFYAELVQREGQGTIPAASYAYGRFASGTPVHDFVRQMFRERTPDWPDDPFTTFEEFLHLPAPGQANESTNFIVTNFIDYIRARSAPLQSLFDLSNNHDRREMVRWYVYHARREYGLDARLIEPIAERLGHLHFPDTSRIAPPGDRADVTLVGYLESASGVGEAARLTLQVLATSGLRIEGIDVEANAPAQQDDRDLAPLIKSSGTGRIQIFNINADQLPFVADGMAPRLTDGAYRIAVPFWELEVFPEALISAFDHVDEIWAPTSYVQTMLVRKQLKPVLRMPIALDIPRPPPMSRSELGLPEHKFLFYFSFDFLSFFERKNPYGLIEAFRRAFHRNHPHDNVGLVIKTMNGHRFPDQLERLQEAARDIPDIIVRDATLSRAHTLALIAACDAVVSLHRCEGLGLLIAEAMALGKPVIATDYAATTDLVHPATGYPVDYRLIPVGADEYPYAQDQLWAEPDPNHAAWLMRRVLTHPQEAAARTNLAKQHLQTHHGQHTVRKRQLARLAELSVA